MTKLTCPNCGTEIIGELKVKVPKKIKTAEEKTLDYYKNRCSSLAYQIKELKKRIDQQDKVIGAAISYKNEINEAIAKIGEFEIKDPHRDYADDRW